MTTRSSELTAPGAPVTRAQRTEHAKGRARRTRRRGTSARRQNKTAYLFLAPWLLGLTLVTIGPMLASLYFSFTDYDILTPPDWISLDNFKEMFTNDPRYMQSLKVTLVYVIVSVPMLLSFALLLALILNTGMRFLPLYRAIFYIPSLMGANVAIALLWRRVFGGDGLLNDFLAVFGYEGPNWISDPDYAIVSLISLNIWTFGSAMVIFLAGLRQIPLVLYQAAAVDGAGQLRKFWHITLPLLTPVLFFNLVLNLIGAFQAFTPAFIVSRGTGGPSDSTLFYTLYLYQQGFSNLRMGYAAAMAWVLLLIIGGFTALMFALGKKWVFYVDET